jgi:predicted nucleic acid-binding protein
LKVLVDTSVWSLALRRQKQVAPEAKELARLIEEGLVVMIGPIRQELLSGISQLAQFVALRDDLGAYEDRPLSRIHFETAAEFSNRCRKQGIQGSHTDFLISAVACLEEMAVFTTDLDFGRYAKHLPLTLHRFKK